MEVFMSITLTKTQIVPFSFSASLLCTLKQHIKLNYKKNYTKSTKLISNFSLTTIFDYHRITRLYSVKAWISWYFHLFSSRLLLENIISIGLLSGKFQRKQSNCVIATYICVPESCDNEAYRAIWIKKEKNIKKETTPTLTCLHQTFYAIHNPCGQRDSMICSQNRYFFLSQQYLLPK